MRREKAELFPGSAREARPFLDILTDEFFEEIDDGSAGELPWSYDCFKVAESGRPAERSC